MKRSKLPSQLAKNASKLHKRVGELLKLQFANYEIRQEYNVSMVNPDYRSNREKFDWVILGLNVAIEVHGQHHYGPVCFGGITKDQAEKNFKRRQQLDEEKRLAAEEACWAYIIVKYDETYISIEDLTSRITRAVHSRKEGRYKQKKEKVKLQSRGFQKQGGKYSWPKRRLQSRGFQKRTK